MVVILLIVICIYNKCFYFKLIICLIKYYEKDSRKSPNLSKVSHLSAVRRVFNFQRRRHRKK